MIRMKLFGLAKLEIKHLADKVVQLLTENMKKHEINLEKIYDRNAEADYMLENGGSRQILQSTSK